MDDTARIKRITEKLATLWTAKPDARFGQILIDIAWTDRDDVHFFERSDEVMERKIDEALLGVGGASDSHRAFTGPGHLKQTGYID